MREIIPLLAPAHLINPHRAMRTALDALVAYFQTRFLARWVLANVAGWALGRYVGSVCLALIGGVIGVILGGALAGAIAGVAQGYALRGQVDASASLDDTFLLNLLTQV